MNNIKLPVELKRGPRPLTELKRWKASELKYFLLYIGPIVLYNLLPENYFRHFLSLSVGIRLLLSNEISDSDIERADYALNYFNQRVVRLYGENFQSYNIHSLRHLPWQVRTSGPLWGFSAFGYESANHFLKMPLTGTRNQAILMGKRYLLRQECAMISVLKDPLESFIRQTLLKEKPPLNVQRFTQTSPAVDIRIAQQACGWLCSEHVVHGRLEHGNHQLHSIGYSRRRENNDSIVGFVENGLRCYGEIQIFVTFNSICMALINKFTISQPYLPNFAYVIVPPEFYVLIHTVDYQSVWIGASDIIRKCCVISKQTNYMVVAPICEMFEHN